MSDMEYHTGKLKLVSDKKLTNEEKISIMEPLLDIEINPWEFEESDHDFIEINDKFYQILDHTSMNEDECDLISKTKKDVYEFRIGFYNGGGCFEECIEEAIIEKEKTEPLEMNVNESISENEKLKKSLRDVVNLYSNLFESGDYGYWDVNDDKEIVEARKLLGGNIT